MLAKPEYYQSLATTCFRLDGEEIHAFPPVIDVHFCAVKLTPGGTLARRAA